MDSAESSDTSTPDSATAKRERNFPVLDLKDQTTLSTDTHPVLIVQSPKTPTLSRKLKAVSLDSEPQQQTSTLELSRDVFSMPNTPKKQIKQKLSCDFDDGPPKTTLAPFQPSSNLKKFASNNSISGSQTLKTLPEINALQDFSDCPNPEPQKVRTKGLLERRGSNASLTIDLGSSQSIPEVKPVPLSRLNTAKSVSNLYLSSMSAVEKCVCVKKTMVDLTKASTVSTTTSSSSSERRKSQEACGNCTIYEFEPKLSSCKSRCQYLKRCHCCAKSRRKSLSNENLYVPPCGFCEGENKESTDIRNGKANNRKALFPRQPDLDSSQLSDEFKLHLQNVQYLQTAGKTMTIDDLRQSCERIPKLQQEFWEVPLNLQEKCYVSGSQSKNRYRGVLPNEHSRVHLVGSGSYIHANYIKGPDYTETAYIATQGPLAHTCIDFWEMVWHSQCKCIVMLTGLVEKGRNKCELYFPLGKKSHTQEKTFFYVKTAKIRDKFTFDCGSTNTNTYDIETYEFEEKNEVTFAQYRITYAGRRDLDECQIRQLELRRTDLNAETRTIHHYWLSNWPDHKKTSAEQVLKLAVDVLGYLDNGKSDISESPSTKPKEHMEAQQIDLKEVDSSIRVPTKNYQDISDCSTNSSQKKPFNFDIANSDNCMETTVTCSDTLQVTQSHIETETSRSITFNNNQTSNCKFSFGESSRNQSKFNYQESNNCSSQIRHELSQTKRDVSISDFNKETLANRCSLDSKLQNLNKMTEFKSHFKRELGPLKVGHERKKSMEHIRLPIIVHCSAGIGRTGCFLAILNGIQQLRLNNTVDVLAILCSLRLNRGGMVQTAEQYELIHRVLSLYIDTM
ncbi:unnamed protein product [Ceutorhynchus assimilis]|uniref:protein-tyrosine-phosphatase n=1 Tax=Ceutorhynchus assimilis TaxID=467358 RepID=A0A9N9MSR5_9CUCU|nr:unnamed protein product [Ceutorhynchus assimilis]